MSRLDESVADAAARGFWDPPAGFDVWGDPLERCAVALWLLGFNTPEDTGGQITREKGREEALGAVRGLSARVDGWGLDRVTRQLHRRRAALVFDVAQRKPKGA